MSAPEVVMGYVAAQTDYIHLGTGSTASRPARSTRSATPSAPRCSTTSPTPLRVGHRPRRRQPRDRQSFNILDKDSTKAEWDEVVHEIPRMWEQVDY